MCISNRVASQFSVLLLYFFDVLMAEGTLSSLGRSVSSSSLIFLQNSICFFFTHTFSGTAVLAFLLISFGPISEKLFQCQKKALLLHA